tara:strand:+ start:512 stop:799 length:288 start_codon:yes stop_codon:yes gene_type:complete
MNNRTGQNKMSTENKTLVIRLYKILKELKHHHSAFIAHNKALAGGYDRTLYANMKYSERCMATLAKEQVHCMGAMTSEEITDAVTRLACTHPRSL